MDLRGRVALVTGAGHRVGRALAVALGGRGMRVAVHYNATAAGAEETVHLIQEQGGSAATFAGDLTDPSTCASLVADVVNRFGGIDVLVNSAAIMKRTPFGEISADDWDAVLSLNLRA